jgi:hypothetical protein
MSSKAETKKKAPAVSNKRQTVGDSSSGPQNNKEKMDAAKKAIKEHKNKSSEQQEKNLAEAFRNLSDICNSDPGYSQAYLLRGMVFN